MAKTSEKERLYGKAYYQDNRERIKAQKKAYYEAHREEGKAKSRAYHETHREKQNARRRVYYQVNQDKERAGKKLYAQDHREQRRRIAAAHYQAHKKERNEAAKRWWRAHPEKKNALRMLRATHKRGVPGSCVDLEFIKERDRMVCGICGKKVRPKDLSFDHIIPLAKGGPHAPWNLQVAHRRCNSTRGAGRTPGKLRLDL